MNQSLLLQLETYWRKHPQQRLGQLISNVTADFHNTGTDLFYVSDADLLTVLKQLNEREEGK